MRRTIALAASVAIMLLWVPAAPAAGEGVDPASVDVTLAPGESATVTKTVDVPEVPPKLDLVLMVDNTGSYYDDLPTIKALKSDIFNGVRAAVADSQFGLATFRDFPFEPWGDGADWAYALDQDLTTAQAAWESAVDSMVANGGYDEPESQLEALYQAAIGAGRDVPPPGASPGDIPAGMEPTWRADATKVIALTTDASMHVAGDSTCFFPSPPCPFAYPGPSFDDTVTALNTAGIKVIAIKAPGATTQMDDLAAATGGAVTTTGSSSTEIVEAILGALEELTFDVTATPVGCEPLDVTFDPAIHEDVPGGTSVQFSETITVPDGTTEQEVSCTVEFKADDTLIGTQTIHVTIQEIVPVDIRPTSCPNPLSLASKGVLPVAILGTAELDVSMIDPSTVELEGVAPIRWALQDVATPFEPFLGKTQRMDCTRLGPDGYMDLTLKFSVQEVLAALGPAMPGDVLVLTLSGETYEGLPILGEDVIWIRP